jgi:hypothetical protein
MPLRAGVSDLTALAYSIDARIPVATRTASPVRHHVLSTGLGHLHIHTQASTNSSQKPASVGTSRKSIVFPLIGTLIYRYYALPKAIVHSSHFCRRTLSGFLINRSSHNQGSIAEQFTTEGSSAPLLGHDKSKDSNTSSEAGSTHPSPTDSLPEQKETPIAPGKLRLYSISLLDSKYAAGKHSKMPHMFTSWHYRKRSHDGAHVFYLARSKNAAASRQPALQTCDGSMGQCSSSSVPLSRLCLNGHVPVFEIGADVPPQHSSAEMDLFNTRFQVNSDGWFFIVSLLRQRYGTGCHSYKCQQTQLRALTFTPSP